MKISFIIPAYNEESNLVELYNRISILNGIEEYDFEFIFIDDGSTDKTLENIKQLKSRDNKINFISLSRNFGHQCALKAGIDYATGDIVIMLDADLQHPPELINEMLLKWEEGYDIITTKRIDKINLPAFKKITSKIFYKLLNWISDIKLDPGSADFRLIDKKVVSVIKNSNEGEIFFRGYISWVGFKQFQIQYNSNTRYSGESKYSLKKMLDFAINKIFHLVLNHLELPSCSD